MFSIADRKRVQERVLAVASTDSRVVGGAVVGSLARSEGDRWSDLDLTFAVKDGVPVKSLLDDWTPTLAAEFDAVHLFDLPSGSSLYRVFLLRGCLQFDLSFTPESDFGATGPEFKLLFGKATDKTHIPPPSAEHLFGYGIHHALRARFCIERGRYWQAEYWISAVRDYALSLACRLRGLETWGGRGFDRLPPDVLDPFSRALIGSLDRHTLLEALESAVTGLLREAEEVRSLADSVTPRMQELLSEWNA